VAGDESLIGSIGVIIIATRGAHGPGEVLLKIRGGTEAYLAWSPEPIRRGATVLVINNRGLRSVDVSAWIDPTQPFPDDVV
jgi:predicted nucleotidyltransferase